MSTAAARESSRLERALLTGLIDYAGLFPPAGLSMAQVVANYASYQRRPDHWALGRLVVPVARLAEFEAALEALPEADRLGTRWPITALLGSDPSADGAAVGAFNERHVHGGPDVRALEGKAESVERITAVGQLASGVKEVFLELSLEDNLVERVAQVRRVGARGKVRAGGTRENEIPDPASVLRFLQLCVATGLSFKATAGLHHPIRGPAPLTYDRGGPCATMHGYLNLVVATGVLWRGGGESAALAALSETARETVRLQEDAIELAGVRLTALEIGQIRSQLLLSIGSCSFTEPLEEFAQLGPALPEPTVNLA